MTVRSIASESVEYAEIAVQASTDPTAGDVAIGFSATADAPATWHDGEWTGDLQTVQIGFGFGQAWIARFLIGTGTLDLAEGEYTPWIRVINGAETVIRSTDDRLVIT